MEKLILLSLPLLLLTATGCTNDEPRVSPCGEDCEVVEELTNVTAKVVQWPITCEFVLSTDSATLIFHEAVGGDSASILLPCEELPPELMVQGTMVIVSGYKYNCCDEFALHPNYDFWQATGCRFEIASIKASPVQLPIEPELPCDEGCEILEELIQVKARVFQWGITCEYVLETDSTLIANEVYLDFDNSSIDILVPCNDIPLEYKSDQLLVTVSGYKYNCCHELTHPLVKPGFGCRFEITAIEPLD